MFAKLLSILSVGYVMKPQRHYILYDEEPRANLDWQCACLLATCVPVTLRSEIFGHTLDAAVDEKDRYASDKRNRCANSQLDLLRLETLMNDAGGFFLDLDVYVLKSLDEWRTRCGGHEAVFGRDAPSGEREKSSTAPVELRRLNPGVLLAPPKSQFLSRWSEAYRRYDPERFDFNGQCNVTSALAAEGNAVKPAMVHGASELGPLPRYSSRALYDAHLAQAPIAHLSAFRHAWRLKDIMNARLLETIWRRVSKVINETAAKDDMIRTNPLLQQCMSQIGGACWAKPGGRCGIYGA